MTQLIGSLQVVVLALNSGFAAHPTSFNKLWEYGDVTIWVPVPPPGFTAVGCVAKTTPDPPPPQTCCCPHSSLLVEAALGECVWQRPPSHLWCVNNAAYTFLVAANGEHMPRGEYTFPLWAPLTPCAWHSFVWKLTVIDGELHWHTVLFKIVFCPGNLPEMTARCTACLASLLTGNAHSGCFLNCCLCFICRPFFGFEVTYRSATNWIVSNASHWVTFNKYAVNRPSGIHFFCCVRQSLEFYGFYCSELWEFHKTAERESQQQDRQTVDKYHSWISPNLGGQQGEGGPGRWHLETHSTARVCALVGFACCLTQDSCAIHIVILSTSATSLDQNFHSC